MSRMSSFVLVSTPGMHGIAENIRGINVYGTEVPHYRVAFTEFSNGETLPVIPETVRGQHVFVLHGLQLPDPNTALVKILLLNDALRRASVAGITLVIPYIPYLRQDRKDRPRVPISARTIADLIESNTSVQRIITADMHTDQAQGFFSIPVDNLQCSSIFASRFKQRFSSEQSLLHVVSPDFGAAVRSRRFAQRLGEHVPVSIIEKRRPNVNESEIVSVVGEPIEGKHVFIFDDMIDTGGTILKTAVALKGMGALSIHLSATHGIFSSATARDRFAQSGLRILCTDSIPRDIDFLSRNPWLEIVSINDLLASAIYEASLVGGSISKLNA